MLYGGSIIINSWSLPSAGPLNCHGAGVAVKLWFLFPQVFHEIKISRKEARRVGRKKSSEKAKETGNLSFRENAMVYHGDGFFPCSS